MIGGNFGKLINILRVIIPRQEHTFIDTNSYLQLWREIKKEFIKNPFFGNIKTTTYNNREEISRKKELDFSKKIKALTDKLLSNYDSERRKEYVTNFGSLFTYFYRNIVEYGLIDDDQLFIENSAYIIKIINKYTETHDDNFLEIKIPKINNRFKMSRDRDRDLIKQYYGVKYAWILIGFQKILQEKVLIHHLFLYFIEKTGKDDIWRKIPIKKLLDNFSDDTCNLTFTNSKLTLGDKLEKEKQGVKKRQKDNFDTSSKLLEFSKNFYNYYYLTSPELHLAQLIEHPEKNELFRPIFDDHNLMYLDKEESIVPKLYDIFAGRLDRETFQIRYDNAKKIHENLVQIFIEDGEYKKHTIYYLLNNYRPDLTLLKKYFNSSTIKPSRDRQIIYYSALLIADSAENLIDLCKKIVHDSDFDIINDSISHITTNLSNISMYDYDNRMIDIIDAYIFKVVIYITYYRFRVRESFENMFSNHINFSFVFFDLPINPLMKRYITLLLLRINPRTILSSWPMSERIYALKPSLNRVNDDLIDALTKLFQSINMDPTPLIRFYLMRDISDTPRNPTAKYFKHTRTNVYRESHDSRDFQALVTALVNSKLVLRSFKNKIVDDGTLPSYLKDELNKYAFIVEDSKEDQTGGLFSIDQLRYKATKYKQRYLRLRSQHHY